AAALLIRLLRPLPRRCSSSPSSDSSPCAVGFRAPIARSSPAWSGRPPRQLSAQRCWRICSSSSAGAQTATCPSKRRASSRRCSPSRSSSASRLVLVGRDAVLVAARDLGPRLSRVRLVLLLAVDDVVSFLELVLVQVFAHGRVRSPPDRALVLADRLRQERARVGAPRQLRIDREPVAAFEHAQRLLQRRAPLRRLEVARELEHGGVVERRLAMEVAAGGEDKERAPDGCVAFVLGDRQGLAREVREHNELYVIRRRSDTRLRSSRA